MNCCRGRSWNTNLTLMFLVLVLSLFIAPGLLAQDIQQDAQDVEDVQPITSEDCVMCHEESSHGTDFGDDLSHSIHRDFECLDCHIDKDTDPHDASSDFVVGCEGCRMCHDDAGDQYQAHGRAAIGTCEDMPQ